MKQAFRNDVGGLRPNRRETRYLPHCPQESSRNTWSTLYENKTSPFLFLSSSLVPCPQFLSSSLVLSPFCSPLSADTQSRSPTPTRIRAARPSFVCLSTGSDARQEAAVAFLMKCLLRIDPCDRPCQALHDELSETLPRDGYVRAARRTASLIGRPPPHPSLHPLICIDCRSRRGATTLVARFSVFPLPVARRRKSL